MSFARNVSGGVDVPEMRAPVSGSTLGDIAQLATAGANIYKMVKEGEKAELQQQQQFKMDTRISQYMSSIEDTRIQKGSLSTSDLITASKKYSEDLSPTEKLQFQEGISKLMSTSYGTAVAGDVATEAATTKGQWFKLDSIDAQAALDQYNAGLVSKGYDPITDINDVPEESLGELLSLGQRKEVARKALESAQKELVSRPSLQAYTNARNAWGGVLDDAATTGMDIAISGIRATGGLTTENKQTVAEIRTGANNYYEQRKISAAKDRQIAISGASDKEIPLIQDEYKAEIDMINSIQKRMNDMTDEVFSEAVLVATDMAKEAEISILKAFPYMAGVTEAFGQSADIIVKDIIIDTGLSKQIRPALRAEIISGSEMLSGELSGERMTMMAKDKNLNELAALVSGQELSLDNLEEREKQISNRWAWTSSILEKPSTVSRLDQTTVDNLAKNMVETLRIAEVEGSAQDQARANALLTSQGFEVLMDRLPEKKQKAVINYVASTTNAKVAAEFGANDWLKYDANSGEVTYEEKAGIPKGARVSDTTGWALSGVNLERKKKANMLNDRIDSAAENLAKYHPYFEGDVAKAKEYVVSTLPASRVDGSVQKFEDIDHQAVKQQKTLAKLKETKTERESAVEALTDIQKLFEGRSRASVEEDMQNAKNYNLIANMSVEEFAEWKKQQDESGTTNTDS